eukprot:6480935-Prymnesium_polylepis.1
MGLPRREGRWGAGGWRAQTGRRRGGGGTAKRRGGEEAGAERSGGGAARRAAKRPKGREQRARTMAAGSGARARQ